MGCACIAALCVGLGAAFAQAESSRPRVVVSYIERMPDLERSRFVLAEAYRRIGIEARFEPYEAAAALEASRSGAVDAELSRIGGIDREFPELVQIPIPVNLIEGVAFSREYRFPIRSWSSLKPFRLGIVRGILFATEGTAGMDVRAAQDHHELARWIATGEVDVGIMSRFSGQAALRAGKHTGISELDGVLETSLLYHYVHESRVELTARLEPVLKAMLLDGTIRRLLDTGAEALRGHP